MTSETLTQAELSEITRSLRDPERFHSDGKEVLWACITASVICVALMAVLFGEARHEIEQIQTGEIFIGTGLLFMAPELLGFVALFLVAIAASVYGFRTYGRHGVVITSFGVARLRGDVKRLIRYADVASVTASERRRPKHNVVTDELEVKAKDGRTISFYGFGLRRRQDLIEREMLANRA